MRVTKRHSRKATVMLDYMGNQIRVGSVVRAGSWGYGILHVHTQGTGTIVGFNPKRVRVQWSGFTYALNEYDTARPNMIRDVNSDDSVTPCKTN